METRVRHKLCQDTISTLSERRSGKTWRELATSLGYEESYFATLNKAARGIPGAMTHKAENILRVRLGLPVIQLMEVPACPDCGEVHTGRCHNKIVVEVVTLGPGERVTTAPEPARQAAPKRKRKARTSVEFPPDFLAPLSAERQATGETWVQYFERVIIEARSYRAMLEASHE